MTRRRGAPPHERACRLGAGCRCARPPPGSPLRSDPAPRGAGGDLDPVSAHRRGAITGSRPRPATQLARHDHDENRPGRLHLSKARFWSERWGPPHLAKSGSRNQPPLRLVNPEARIPAGTVGLGEQLVTELAQFVFQTIFERGHIPPATLASRRASIRRQEVIPGTDLVIHVHGDKGGPAPGQRQGAGPLVFARPARVRARPATSPAILHLGPQGVKPDGRFRCRRTWRPPLETRCCCCDHRGRCCCDRPRGGSADCC